MELIKQYELSTTSYDGLYTVSVGLRIDPETVKEWGEPRVAEVMMPRALKAFGIEDSSWDFKTTKIRPVKWFGDPLVMFHSLVMHKMIYCALCTPCNNKI